MNMNCQETRDRILVCGARPGSLEAEPSAHLDTCHECHDWYADLTLDSLLDNFRIPEPSNRFVDRVIDAASRSIERQPSVPALAIAACIAVIGITIGLFLDRSQASAVVFEVAMAPYEERLVEVVIDTRAEREQTTLTIVLPDGLELAGFPDKRTISWQTDLAAGKNLLALPLRLNRDADAHFTVQMSYGSTEQAMRVKVRAEPEFDQQISA